jgi:hypothetical protein
MAIFLYVIGVDVLKAEVSHIDLQARNVIAE